MCAAAFFFAYRECARRCRAANGEGAAVLLCCAHRHFSASAHLAREPRTMATQYWLMKSEPDEASIDTLHDKGTLPWTGVRNYQARNFMRDRMRIGDGVLFYHSSCRSRASLGWRKSARPAIQTPPNSTPKVITTIQHRSRKRRAGCSST